jgi:hypothetical protein
MSLWKGKKSKRLDEDHLYRCISPSPQELGMKSFYGPDRSFCRGMIFDTADIIVEFTIDNWDGIDAIPHHHSSYRGPLIKENSTIIAIYFKKHPLDYNKDIFGQHLTMIYNQLPLHTPFYQYKSSNYDVIRRVVITSQF